MATQDFALNPTATERINVHWTTPDRPATVLLNGSVLGVLATSQEQELGKNFTLPDQSPLHVRFQGNQPQVFRHQYPLVPIHTPLVAPQPAPSFSGQKRKWPRWLLFWLILNLILVVVYTVLNLIDLADGLTTGSFLLLSFTLLLVLADFVGIAGLGLLLAWKKIGFYLLAGYVIVVFVLDVLVGLLIQDFNFRSFLPLLVMVWLYFRLRRPDVSGQFS